MRNEARKVSKLYEEKLSEFGKIINPGFLNMKIKQLNLLIF
jgi:hypothetical protein